MTEYVAMRIAEGDRNALDFYVNELLRSLQFYYSLPKYGGKSGGFLVGSESDQAARMVLQRAQSLIAQSSANSVASFNALESFLRSTSSQTGRKLIFFITGGFLLHGDAALAGKLQRLTDAAARAGSMIYTLDARALAGNDKNSRTRVDALGRLDKFNSGEQAATQTALSTIAANTGGRALLNFNTLDAAVQSALKETFNYYLLAWRPENEAQKIEKFRQVEISIKGRPELNVRMSRGYLEADAKTRLAQANAARAKASNKNVSLKSATDEPGAGVNVSTTTKQSLPTRLAVGFLNMPNNGTVLTASTQIAVDALSYGENEKEAAAIDLAGVVLNEQGSVASSFQTRLNVEPLSQERRQAENSSVIYNHRIQLMPGLYQVRVAAREAKNGHIGHARQWIEIPDLAAERLTLSTLFLGGQMIEAGERQAGATSASAPQMQFSVDHRFKRASRLSFFVFIYNASRAAAASKNLTADIRVMQDGQAVLALPQQRVPIEATADLQRIPYGGSFPLGSLSAGRYQLQITITDRSTQASAQQQIEFEID
ncbi:MAG: VWA domain-containing protein [Pyrinomonadaceae bacterium]|nr:VWA domain-containing protein [Pyrinomonadaceae bacterium]